MKDFVWNKNYPGDNPVCIVGAGFQMAVLEKPRPSTACIIRNTVQEFPTEFPALRLLEPLLTRIDLNYVWTNIERISQVWKFLTRDVLNAYAGVLATKPVGQLAAYLRKQLGLPLPLQNPESLLSTILGLELKRMLALQYDQKKLKVTDSSPEGLVNFLDATKTNNVTWISLNYDLCLEALLQENGYAKKWRYGFEDLFELQDRGLPNEITHVIVKPHGSLNVWFTTVWESRTGSGKGDLHELFFVDPADKFRTCLFDEIGYVAGTDPAEEKRPWVIGYLPDEMKDELNSPGVFADTAHDLCKWNMSYAGLSLQKASALYVLAYSLPDEDRWIWERLASLRRKHLPVYVASDSDTKRILRALRSYGFTNAQELSDNGLV